MSRPLIPLILCGITACIYAQAPCTVENSVRLEGLPRSRAGRVEICHNGVWGTVCGESDTIPWSEKNAQVVCRQLGYSGALNSILQDTLPFSSRAFDPVPVHYRGVSCLGNEVNLTSCLGIAEVGPSDNCPHNNDVAITCRSTFENSAGVGDVRLTGDPVNGRGAVQLFDETHGWIDVCYDSTWLDDEANVVCRQLGYESGTARTYSIGSSSRTAHSFSCDENSDETINDCTYSTQSSCFSNQRGGVECISSSLQEGSIRLAGSTLSNEGRVEILYNGRWGTICDSSWDDIDGEAACHQLGIESGSAITSSSGLYDDPSSVKPIWLTDIFCLSTDLELSECIHGNPIGYVNCVSGDAELECGVGDISIGSDDELSEGAVLGIIFGLCILLGVGIALFVVTYVFWEKCWHAFTCPCRWIRKLHQRNRHSRPTVTPSSTATVPTPIARPSDPENRDTTPEPTSSTINLITTATIEPEEPTEDEQETEFTRPPPPSFQMASNFPTADPSAPPPSTDLPPPYPGPQATPYPPANPYPPATSYPPANPYPPATSDSPPSYPSGPIVQGYPPTNFGYPPSNIPYPPTLDPAYPPPTDPDLPSVTPDTD